MRDRHLPRHYLVKLAMMLILISLVLGVASGDMRSAVAGAIGVLLGCGLTVLAERLIGHSTFARRLLVAALTLAGALVVVTVLWLFTRLTGVPTVFEPPS